jgi:PhnB protein
MPTDINIPEGYHQVTPYLVLKDPQATIDFLEKVVDARILMPPMYREDGGFMHGEIAIGDCPLMLGGAMDGWPPTPGMFYVYVSDADATYEKALAAGGSSIMPPADQPHGDRYGMVADPQGNQWCFAQSKEVLSDAEIRERYGSA